MKHIVFMVRNYYPYYSAVGVCIGNVAESMSQGNKITILCEKVHFEEADKEIYNNQNIVRIMSKSTRRRKKLQKLMNSSNIFKKYTGKILNDLYRTFEYTGFLVSKFSTQRGLVEEYYKALNEISEPFDILVPTCMPFETILAAIKYKDENQHIEVVPFLFDKFAENGTLHRTKWNKKFKMKNNLDLEREVFEKSHRILFTPSWIEHLNKNFAYMKNKFRPVEHPLLKKIEPNEVVMYDNKKVNIVYTGTVVRDSRNPEPTIEIFDSIIPLYPDIFIHFYAMGNAVESIKNFEDRHRNNVKFHGQVATEIAHSAIVNSTVLLSIGNVDTTQTPSKIFEYMSCCKPIIHISVFANDPVIEILCSYPKACCVCLETDLFEEQVEKVKNFLSERYLTEVNFSDLEKNFFDAIPNFSADQILDRNKKL
jgi:glycosyltransferase involved in cell wall biosynthesis